MELFGLLPADNAGVMATLSEPGAEFWSEGATPARRPDAGALAGRQLVTVPADEAVPGDRVRDHGVLRQVTSVEASVVERSVVLFFDPADGFDDPLFVPLFQTVSVWRLCRER